ncbi:MAG: molybdopterin-dependent oxidoreductase [Acidobacteriota bacterium]|nr:molybdopterin-dependent oxidoreductase [Acidobacteriota bacterium]
MNGESEMKETDVQHRSGDAKENPNAPAGTPPTMDRAAAPQMPMPGLLLTLDDIKSLPRVEMTTELKCIEGWSVVVNWAGARFSDFIRQYQPQTRDGNAPDIENQPENLVQYVSMVTPDGGYYVGMDMPKHSASADASLLRDERRAAYA